MEGTTGGGRRSSFVAASERSCFQARRRRTGIRTATITVGERRVRIGRRREGGSGRTAS